MLPAKLSPELVRKYFLILQIAVGGAFIAFLWLLRQRKASATGFKLREAERLRNSGSPRPAGPAKPDPLAQARIARKSPLSLPGIRIDGSAHEILGIAPGASTEDIQKAYRELMKRYHPDKVGRPGTREWQDAQKIAEALNRAKEEMLVRVRSRGGV